MRRSRQTEKAAQPRRRRAPAAVGFDTVLQLALPLPGVEEGTSYGTPALRVRGKFFARLREDGETLVIKIEPDERDLLLAADPQVFYITDHYRNYPAVLVHLSKIDRTVLRDLLEQSWRLNAPRRLVAAHDGES